jgi:hypothetical protein
MTKTILTLLVGGAVALASLTFGNDPSSLSPTTRSAAETWAHASVHPAQPAVLAWMYPPMTYPPTGKIKVLKGVEQSARCDLAWMYPPMTYPPTGKIKVLKGVESGGTICA